MSRFPEAYRLPTEKKTNTVAKIANYNEKKTCPHLDTQDLDSFKEVESQKPKRTDRPKTAHPKSERKTVSKEYIKSQQPKQESIKTIKIASSARSRVAKESKKYSDSIISSEIEEFEEHHQIEQSIQRKFRPKSAHPKSMRQATTIVVPDENITKMDSISDFGQDEAEPFEYDDDFDESCNVQFIEEDIKNENNEITFEEGNL
jgi:hypothetical protein